LADSDRLAAGRGRRLLVRPAGLDRARVQADQAGGLAMAIHPYDRSGAGRTSVASHRLGDLVAALGRRRGRSPHRLRHLSTGSRFAPATRPTLASGRDFPSGLVPHHGGPFRTPRLAVRERMSRTLAFLAHFEPFARPCGAGATEPVVRHAFTKLSAGRGATQNRRAAARAECPASTNATIRSRKSIDKGFPSAPGLLFAQYSMNHILALL
jgi:hypothetical protein